VTLGDKRAEPLADIRSREPIGSTFSPDGRWIAYSVSPKADVRAPDRGVFVQPFPPTKAIYQAPRLIVDFHPVWTRDGRELVYVAAATSGQMAAVSVNTASGVAFGAPARFPSAVTGDRLSGEPRAFDIMADGRFIGPVNVGDDQTRASSSEIRVILNWFEELKQRVPAK
jgi:hypothetical protein